MTSSNVIRELGRDCTVADVFGEVLFRGSYDGCLQFMLDSPRATELLVPVATISKKDYEETAVTRKFESTSYVSPVPTKSRRASHK